MTSEHVYDKEHYVAFWKEYLVLVRKYGMQFTGDEGMLVDIEVCPVDYQETDVRPYCLMDSGLTQLDYIYMDDDQFWHQETITL